MSDTNTFVAHLGVGQRTHKVGDGRTARVPGHVLYWKEKRRQTECSSVERTIAEAVAEQNQLDVSSVRAQVERKHNQDPKKRIYKYIFENYIDKNHVYRCDSSFPWDGKTWLLFFFRCAMDDKTLLCVHMQ